MGNFVRVEERFTPQDTNVVAQLHNGFGQPRGREFRVHQSSSGDQGRPAVAMDAQGNFVVVWKDGLSCRTPPCGQLNGRDGSGWSIFAQVFDRNGQRLGDEMQVNKTTGDQYSPGVGMISPDEFLGTWIDETRSERLVAQQYGKPLATSTPEPVPTRERTNDPDEEGDGCRTVAPEPGGPGPGAGPMLPGLLVLFSLRRQSGTAAS